MMVEEGLWLVKRISPKIYYCLIEAKLKTMMQGKRAGADDFLLKPFDREILTNTFADQARTAA